MGKKGKGGKNKLARMSEEERARYLQHRADIEEEARRRKQQLIALYMKNKLKREDAFTRLNLAKINQEWRFILRQVKCNEMKDEIKSVEELFTQCVDRKNRMIRRLLCDLDEAEELYATMLHSHMENIENLIGIHSDRLQFIRDKYVKEKKLILKTNAKEIENYKGNKTKIQKELECVFYGLEEITDKQKSDYDQEHQRRKDELKNSMVIKLEVVTKERETQMEFLWIDFQKVLNGYLQHTEQYRNEYIDLRQRDADDTKNIKCHYLEVARATEHISELKYKFGNIKEEHDFNINQLMKYRGDLQKRHEAIKYELDTGLSNDKEKLKCLVVGSNKSIKKLENNLKSGGSILQIASICRKMETEREKVLPFGARKNRLFEYLEKDMKLIPKDFKEDTAQLLSNLENFWLRYNRVRVDTSSLAEEKQSLRDENIRLKEKLKDYLTSVTSVTGAGGTNETRLVNRPSSMRIERIVHIDVTKSMSLNKPIKRRPVTCIEGNLSVAVRSRSLLHGKLKTPNIFSVVQNL